MKVGEIYITNNFGKVKVVVYNNARKVIVRFNDGTEVVAGAHSVRNGRVYNPNHPNICNKGYRGVGKYSKKTHLKLYGMFNSMFARCYGSKSERVTYNDCRVSKRWHNFQNYCKDVEKMIGYGIEGIELDKDILVPGNRLYSRKRCVLVPHVINNLVKKSTKPSDLPLGVCILEARKHLSKPYGVTCKVNGKSVHLGYYATPEYAFVVYKKFKEKQIKKVAREYKAVIDPLSYKALLNYKVEPH